MGKRAKPRTIPFYTLFVVFFAGMATNALTASIIEYLTRGN